MFSSSKSQKKLNELIEELEFVPEGFSSIANPFDDELRRNSFGAYLFSALDAGVDFLLVSDAPSCRGCLLTGIPLTDPVELRNDDNAYALGSWTKPKGFPRAREHTSKFLWEEVRRYHLRPLLWNAFPFQTYGVGPRCVDRTFSKKEMEAGRHYIDVLCDIFEIDEANRYALGRPAQFVLHAREDHFLNHPAVTGSAEFAQHFEEKIAPFYATEERILA